MIIFCNGLLAQNTFYKHLGNANIDRGVTVEEIQGDGFIISGYTTKEGGKDEDVLLIKTDHQGEPLWSKVFGSEGQDHGWAVRQTTDKGFIIVGYSDSFGAGDMDVYLIKTDEEGIEQWSKTYGGKGDEFGWDIRKTTDNGFIIAAQTNSLGHGEVDAYLIKIDADGNEEWSNSYGGEKVDRIFSVRQTNDGGFIAAGITYSFGSVDRNAYLLKTNEWGKLEWSKTFGEAGYDVGHAIEVTDDKGFLITGYGESYSTHGGRDVYLIKTDGNGDQQLLQTFGGPANDRAMKGVQTKDGGYITIGFTQEIHATKVDWQVYLIKTASNGEMQWSRTFGNSDHHEFGYTVEETHDGGYILTGQSVNPDNGFSSVLLIKTDHAGKIEP